MAFCGISFVGAYKKDGEIFFIIVISECAAGSGLTVIVFVLTSVNLDMNYMQTWKLYDIFFFASPSERKLISQNISV